MVTAKMDTEFTEKLIQEVRSRPILYSLHHPQYKNNKEKLQAWKEIQKELNKGVETLKAKWKNMKDTHRKYTRSVQNNKGHARQLQNWAWADQMSFMEYSIVQNETQDSKPCDKKPTICNSQENTEDSEIGSESNSQKVHKTETIYTRQQRRIDRDSSDRRIQYLRNRTRNHNLNDGKVDINCDGVDLLFLGYADTFKKLSNRNQVKVKFDIAKILMEAELRDLDNGISEIYSKD